jgi:hypothetical protein
MLSVEDALEKLADLVQDTLYTWKKTPAYRFNKWDQEFIIDMHCHVVDKRPVSTAQGAIILKLIKQHRHYLEGAGLASGDIDALLASPVYRITPYQSTVLPREVRWLGGNSLAFRCKFNQNVVDDIKRLRWNNPLSTGQGSPHFAQNVKLWIVHVTEDNIEQVMSVIQRHRFAFDSDVEQMFLRIVNAPRNRGTIELKDDTLTVEVSNDFFMHTWTQGVLRLDGQSV